MPGTEYSPETMTATPPTMKKPARRVRWGRWAVGLLLAVCAYGAWMEFAKRRAIRELEAAGFVWEEENLFTAVRANWRNVFYEASWRLNVRTISPRYGYESKAKSLDSIRGAMVRLEPRRVFLKNMYELAEVDALKGIRSIESVELVGSFSLRNVNGLRGLPRLRDISIWRASESFDWSGISDLPSLEKLLVNVTSASLSVRSLSNLPKLETFVIKWMPCPREIGWVMEFPALRMLRFIEVTDIPEKEIAELRKARPDVVIERMDVLGIPAPL